MEYDMKAEEAKIRSMESRSRLVTEQLKTVHRSIDIAVKEGRISTRVLDIYPSVCNVGWLDEVVEKLKDEGYTVNLVHDLLIVEWGDVKEVEKRPVREPHIIKEGGNVGGIIAGAFVVSVLIVLLLALFSV